MSGKGQQRQGPRLSLGYSLRSGTRLAAAGIPSDPTRDPQRSWPTCPGPLLYKTAILTCLLRYLQSSAYLWAHKVNTTLLKVTANHCFPIHCVLRQLRVTSLATALLQLLLSNYNSYRLYWLNAYFTIKQPVTQVANKHMAYTWVSNTFCYNDMMWLP